MPKPGRKKRKDTHKSSPDRSGRAKPKGTRGGSSDDGHDRTTRTGTGRSAPDDRHDRTTRTGTGRSTPGDRHDRTTRTGTGRSAPDDRHDRTSRTGTGRPTPDDRHDRTTRTGAGRSTPGDRHDRTTRTGTGRSTSDDRHDRTARNNTRGSTPDDRHDRTTHIDTHSQSDDQHSDDEVVFGRKPVLHALRSGLTINRLLAAKGAHGGDLDEIFQLARQDSVPFDSGERLRLDRLANGGNHQGVIAILAARPYADFGKLLQTACGDEGNPAFIVFLDGIQDPHNLGAIIRSAHAVKAAGIVIERRRCAPLTGSVAKASAGSVDHVPVSRVTNLRHAMQSARDRGLWLAGLEPEGDSKFTELDYSGPLGVVIGGEAKGLRPGIRDACDFRVTIPLGRLEVGSLNASVAAGLMLYEVFRHRTAGG